MIAHSLGVTIDVSPIKHLTVDKKVKMNFTNGFINLKMNKKIINMNAQSVTSIECMCISQ